MRTDELWCNGSTTDSDSVCLGSNPGSSTKVPLLRGAFFVMGGAWWNAPRCHLLCEILKKLRFLREKVGKNGKIHVILYIN